MVHVHSVQEIRHLSHACLRSVSAHSMYVKHAHEPCIFQVSCIPKTEDSFLGKNYACSVHENVGFRHSLCMQ